VQKGSDEFIQAALDALSEVGAQAMLTDGIAQSYRDGAARVEKSTEELLGTSCADRAAKPYLFKTSVKEWLAETELQEEVFGPLGIIVEIDTTDDMFEIARAIEGQLTCTIHMDDADTETAQKLMPLLERKAGRVLVNGFPTGVEVCDAMVHGGPYPASTNFGATSVGTMAIRRFLRPVSYQNVPDALLPVAF